MTSSKGDMEKNFTVKGKYNMNTKVKQFLIEYDAKKLLVIQYTACKLEGKK